MDPEGMVHALRETWRVLKPEGVLIDLRPLSSDPPIEIVSASGAIAAGPVDESPGRPLDVTSDEAIETVVREGAFRQESKINFGIAFYWDTLEGLLDYARDRWEGSAVVPDDVVEEAERLVGAAPGPVRLRLPRLMLLGRYTKRLR